MTQVEFNAWIRARFNLWTKSDVDAAIKAEREACAQVAFSWNIEITDKVAEEIRARGEA